MADLVQGILIVRAGPGKGRLFIVCPVEDHENICIAFRKPVDHAQLGIHALHQTVHSSIQLVFCVASLDVHNFTVDNNLCSDNGFLNIATRPLFKGTGLLLPLSDNILNAFRELGDIPLLDILTDFHCLFQFLEVWGFIGQDDYRFIIYLRIHDKPLIRRTVKVTCHSNNAQPHPTGGGAIQRLIYVLVIGKVILTVLKFLRRIDFTIHRLGNARRHLCAVNHRITDIDGNILLFVGQKCIGVPVAGNVILRQQPLKGLRDRRSEGNLIGTNVINHQNSNVVDIRFNVVNVPYQIQQFQDVHILLFQSVVVVSRGLAAVNDAPDRALKESMDSIIEEVEGDKGILVLILHLLCRFLESGQHRTLTTGKMLAGIAVFPNFSKYLLDDDKLIRHKGEGGRKLRTVRKSLDVQHRIVEGVKVFQDGVFFIIHHAEKLICLFILCQHTFFNDLIDRGRGQAEASIETPLNLGKVIAGDMNDGINRLLTGNHNPDFPHATGSDFFCKGLQIHHQIPVVADILTNLVHHKQQSEVLAFSVHIFFDVCDELGNAQLICLFAVKPVPGSLFTHAEDRLQYFHNIVLKEGEGIPRLHPRRTVDFFKSSAELIGLAPFFNKAFQPSDLQVVAVEAAMIVEHFGKNAQNGSLILRDRSFDVDIE